MEGVLEEKIKKAIELIKQLKTENEELNKKIKSMTVELEAIKSLRDERDKLKKDKNEAIKRVESILKEIEAIT